MMGSKEPAPVAYVLPNLGRGGTEKHVRDLVERIDRGKFAPHLVAIEGGGAMQEEFSRLGVPVHVLEERGLRGVFRLSEIFSAHGVRIVHCYLPLANLLGVAAALRSRAAVKIVSKRALCRYKEGHAAYSLLEDLANLAADAVMVNSRAVAEDVRRTERFLGRKMFLVYNGVNVRDGAAGEGAFACPPDLGVPPGASIVSYIANLREDKAHLCLVDAAHEVCADFPSARFLFVGREDAEAKDVRARIGELGLQDRVLLTGPREDIPQILRASRIVAHPGEQEGFSNAILEAMAAGLPVVASRAGGNPEVIREGETGLLFPPGDTHALARAILDLLRDSGRAESMGRAGRLLVAERFSIDRMVKEVETAYGELLEGRPLSCGA